MNASDISCLLCLYYIADKRKKLEEEKGIVVRFVIGHRWVFELQYIGFTFDLLF